MVNLLSLRLARLALGVVLLGPLDRALAAVASPTVTPGSALIPAGPEAGSPTFDGLLTRARELAAKNLAKGALEAATAASALQPDDPRPYFLKAQIHERLNDLPAAEAAVTKVIELRPGDPARHMQRGMLRLRLANFAGSIADLDRVAELRPANAAELWQRGIALFYAGRYDDGRRQFESHRTVNPHDVENSAWHFACVAWAEGFAAARKRLLPCDGDSRVPMTRIQALYGGQAQPRDVLDAAAAEPEGPRRRNAEFYAHLYLALYHGAERKPELETRHAAEAARRGRDLGIMGEVARLHADWIVARLADRKP